MPRMKNPKVELNGQEWGWVLDGLACRVALYEETVGYYKHGVSYGHIAEVNGVEEAQAILRYYRRIIRNIKTTRRKRLHRNNRRFASESFVIRRHKPVARCNQYLVAWRP